MFYKKIKDQAGNLTGLEPLPTTSGAPLCPSCNTPINVNGLCSGCPLPPVETVSREESARRLNKRAIIPYTRN
jgi:hypothetical protein